MSRAAKDRERLARRDAHVAPIKYAARLSREKSEYAACHCGNPQCYGRYDLLEDMTLLDGAVFVNDVADRTTKDSLAVPVGGKRRGGCVLIKADQAESVISRLKVESGFPDPRVYDAPPEDHDKYDDCFVGGVYVEWGEPYPMNASGAREVDSEIIGRYYGYAERSIQRHLLKVCFCAKCVAAQAFAKQKLKGVAVCKAHRRDPLVA